MALALAMALAMALAVTNEIYKINRETMKTKNIWNEIMRLICVPLLISLYIIGLPIYLTYKLFKK